MRQPWRNMRAMLIALSLAISPPAIANDLRAAVATFPPGLGNPFTGANQPGSEIWMSIYDTLVMLDWGKGAHPGLALSWRMEAPNRWVFQLRPDVVYHSGKSFTAADVVGVFDVLKSPASAGYLISVEAHNVAAVKARDPLTVEIETRTPDAILPRRLATVMMIDPALWTAVGADTYAREPIGTGPYRLVSWGPANKAADLEANPRSWRAPKAVNKLSYRVIAEQNARIQALLSNQIDLATGLQVEDIDDLRARGFRTHVRPNPQLKSIALRTVRDGDHPLLDVRVRRALNHAVDKGAIADVMMEGHVTAVGQGAAPGLTGYNPDVAPYRYDPERARALLAEAGYDKGLSLNIEVVTQSATPDALIYQKIAQDLAAVGVKVQLRSITVADYQGKYTSGQWGNVDGFSQTWNNASYQDPIRAIEYFSCLKPNPFFCDPSLVPAIKAINAELDLGRREQQLMAYMALIHDAAPAIWITNAAYVIGHSDKIPAVEMAPTGITFERLTLAP